MQQVPDWAIWATLAADGGFNVFFNSLSSALPSEAKLIASIGSIIAAIAVIAVMYYKAKYAPAQAVVKDAPIVTQDGTPTGALNVTTTTTGGIQAPFVGKT